MPIVFDPDQELFGFGNGAIAEAPLNSTGLSDIDWVNLPDDAPKEPSPPPVAPTRKQPRRRAKTTKAVKGQADASPGAGDKHNRFTIKRTYSQIVGNSKATDKLFSFRTMPVYREDIDYILPGEWLNDLDISIMYELLGDLLEHHGLKEPLQLIYPLVVHLLMYLPMDPHDLLPKEVVDAQFLFLPVNVLDEEAVQDDYDGDHWALTLFSVLENKLYVYDLMADDDGAATFTNLAKKLQSVKLIVRLHKPISVEMIACDQQKNFDDCGVFVVMITALLVLRFIRAKLDDVQVDLNVEHIKLDGLQGRGDIMSLIRCLQLKMEAEDSSL